jgi:hypothetical protein
VAGNPVNQFDLNGDIEMGARLYVPGRGRFLQVDPIPGGSANNYDYVNGDPINRFDLNGDCWGWGCRIRRGVGRFVARTARNATRPFNVGWSLAGVFIVRAFVYSALVGLGVSGSWLVAGLILATIAWYVIGQVLSRRVIPQRQNQWAARCRRCR